MSSSVSVTSEPVMEECYGVHDLPKSCTKDVPSPVHDQESDVEIEKRSEFIQVRVWSWCCTSTLCFLKTAVGRLFDWALDLIRHVKQQEQTDCSDNHFFQSAGICDRSRTGRR